jgi:tetratricopeptide (TPR) repeat protein
MSKVLLAILGTWLMITSPGSAAPDFDSLWDYDDPASTETRLRALLPDAESSADRAYEAELLTQIARTLGLQRKFDSAHTVLDRVAGMLPTLGARPRARYLLELGRTLNSSGHPDSARPRFQEAFELALDSGLDAYAVDAAHMLAIVAPPSDRMAWNEKAAELAQNSDEPRARRWLGSLYNNMGWDRFDAGDWDSALVLFQSALDFRIQQSQPREIRVARWCVARAQRQLGRIDEALKAQLDLKAEIDSTGATQDGYVFEEIAECLLTLGRGDEARPYFRRAWESLSSDPWLAEKEPDRLARLRRLGEEP